MTELRAGGATHVGQVRSNNQDSFVILAEADVYGVADGMGGHQGGEVASAMAVEALREHAGEPSLENLKQAARLGNRAIFEKAGADAELRGMGTTLCALRVVPGDDGEGEELAWINVGDSRVYLLRDHQLLQLSRDHSLVEDLLRDGQLTEEEAAVHPKRNIITRALGIDVDVDVDGSTVIPFTGDRFVLCSDGLFGEVSNDQIASVLRRLADPTEAADELVRLANEAGGRDNITVVVVDVVDDGGRSARAAEILAAEQARLKARDAEAEAAAAAAAAEAADVDAEPYVPVFADRKSSLPDADDDFTSQVDSPYAGMEGLDSKRFTWRVAVFGLALLAVVAVVVGAFAWSARGTYYVGFEGDRVALFQGRPGGVLWMDPQLEEVTPIERDDLPADVRAEIDGDVEFGSRSGATGYLVTLQALVDEREAAREAAEQATSTTTSTTSTTTTTRPTTTSPATTTTTAPPTTPGG